MSCAKPFLRLMVRDGVKVNVPLPCGYCASCRRDKIRMWSDRLSFESIGKPSTFLTLTYDDAHCPKDGVRLSDWQRFHDRLRHKVSFKYKYYVTSEYGSVNYRPHYHVCLIGFDWRVKENYMAIDYAWEGKGFFDCSSLNPARIRYTLKYISKELKGNMTDEYVSRGLNPLFHTMSKGIGRDFFFQNIDQLRKQKGYFMDGKLRPLPRYYADLLRLYDDLPRSEFVKLFDKYKTVSSFNAYLPPVRYSEDDLHDNVRNEHLEKLDALDEFNTIV